MLLYQPRVLLFWRYYSSSGKLYAVLNADVPVGIGERLNYSVSVPEPGTFKIVVNIDTTGYSQLPDIEMLIDNLAIGLDKTQVKAEIAANPDFMIHLEVMKDDGIVGESRSSTLKSTEVEMIN